MNIYTLIIVRHGKKNGDALAPEGVRRGYELAIELAKENITHAVSTEYNRAKQMRDLIVCGDPNIKCSELPNFLSTDPNDPILQKWVEIITRAHGSHSLSHFLHMDKNGGLIGRDCPTEAGYDIEAQDFVRSEQRRCGQMMVNLCAKNGPGSVTLFVGHSPVNEAALAGLTRDYYDLKEGEGVVLMADQNHEGFSFRIVRRLMIA